VVYSGMSSENWSLLLALIGLPVLAAVCLGMVARAFVEGGGNHWGIWLAFLGAICAVWVIVFRLTP
jgi:hypothetical protein